MLFAFYNVNPVVYNQETNINQMTSTQSTINTIRQRIIQMPQLIFLKRDLTEPMGLLRHFPTDLVNSVLNELSSYELSRQGRKHWLICISVLFRSSFNSNHITQKFKSFFFLIFIFKAFLTTTARVTVFIRSYPSHIVLNDSLKRIAIDQLLNDINIDLTTYIQLLTNSIIKEKQVLTTIGKQILMLPEHKFLYEKLNEKYPERQLEIPILLEQTSDHHIQHQPSNSFNQLSLQSQNTSIYDNSDEMSIILDPARKNMIIENIHTNPIVINTLYHTQQLTSVELSRSLLNTTTSSNSNEISSSIQETHMKEKSNEQSLHSYKNLNDTSQKSTDIDPYNKNSIHSKNISNIVSNVELQNITTPITNILLSTPFINSTVDQLVSNSSNESIYITSTQSQTSHTTDTNTSLNISESYNTSVNNQASYDVNAFDTVPNDLQ
ncbi:unnamed protein product [Adineta steineri]|uniref:Uncharacterized protein n=1 Tax=Adineta steineri TaxID=433720 RepID=A0A819WCJ0_9BILA|nr:unnamed protein product [Adineta steineri]